MTQNVVRCIKCGKTLWIEKEFAFITATCDECLSKGGKRFNAQPQKESVRWLIGRALVIGHRIYHDLFTLKNVACFVQLAIVGRFTLTVYQQSGANFVFIFSLFGFLVALLTFLDYRGIFIKRLKSLDGNEFFKNAIGLAAAISIFAAGMIELTFASKLLPLSDSGIVGLVYVLFAASISGALTQAILSPFAD